jgi:hypothetical protein
MSLRVSLCTRLGAVLAALFATASANAEFVRVTAANSVGNSIYDVASFSAATCQSNCGTISPLNSDGARHGSFSSVVLVTNSTTGTVDVLVADATKGQVIRYTPAYNSSSNQPVAACETVIWPASGSNGQGPAKPDGLSTDANNNLYIVTNKKPALWVLPATANYACGTNGGYAANPLLIDNSSFFALGDLVLRDTAVATDTTAAWGPGDLLLLVGSKNKANSAELAVYRQSTIQKILNGGGAVSAPDAILIPASGFPSGEFPQGLDFFPATSPGGHTTIVIATTAGRVLQYDFTANGIAPGYPLVFASGLGSGLQKLKVGLYLEVPYAFVTSTTPGSGEILQLGAPNGGQTNLVGVANVGTNAPDALAVARAAAVPATACAFPNVPAGTPPAPQNICDIGGKGVAPHTIYTYNQTVTGDIVEQTCVVLADPRYVNGVFSGASLDISTVCNGFGHEIIPGTLRGGSGLSGTGFAVVQTSAPGVDNLGGIIVYTNINADAILPPPQGGQNPPCPGAIAAWAPRGEAGEGTVLKVVNGQTQSVDEFVDMTFLCDYPGSGSRGASDYLVGTVLNTSGPNGTGSPQTYANQKFLDLQATINAANISAQDATTLNTDLAAIYTYLQQQDYACAADEVINLDSDVASFQPDAAASPGWATPQNPNPWGEIRGRSGQLYNLLNTAILGNPPNNNWPVSSGPTCSVPTVTVTASNYSVAANTPLQITWTSKHALSCTAWGGSPSDGWPAAGAVLPTSGGPTTVTPAGTTTYGVDCTGFGGDSGMTAGDSVVITVVPPPNITSFVANPASVTANVDTSVLSWSESTGANCTVSGGPITPINATSVRAGPINATTMYTLTCTNSVSSQASKMLTLTAVPAPAIGLFTANPMSVTAGVGTAVLSWTESTGASCGVSGGPFTPISSTSVKAGPISVTTSYTLTCTNAVGYQSSAAVTLTAVANVKINSFTATPNRVDGDGDSDDNSTLSWQSSNATSCALSGGGLNVSGLPTSSSYFVSKIKGTTTYMLTCTNTSGGIATANATVTATGERRD